MKGLALVLMLGAVASWLAACSSGGTGGAGAASPDASPGDAGAASDGAAADSSRSDGRAPADAPPGAKRIFITQATFQGSLASGGGLTGGDAACSAAAQAASLGGSWTAWLSTSTVDAI